MEIIIIEMTHENIDDINKPNQPFDVIGKIVPVFQNEEWTFSECLFDESYEKSYPNDEEDWHEYIENPEKVIFLYYENNECIGQVRLRKNWNKYAYIEDIAVSKNHRNKGVGHKLIEKAIEWANQKNLFGLMLETQDVNLQACRFYSKIGFQIGAVDTMLYGNFSDTHEKAIFWYMKF